MNLGRVRCRQVCHVQRLALSSGLTLNIDGAGLFFGILKYLIGQKSACPKVLAATHFHELFRDDIVIPEHLPVTFVHMRIVLTSSKGDILMPDENSGSDDDEKGDDMKVLPGERITYLYK